MWMISPVRPDLPPSVVALEEHEHAFRALKDLKRLREKEVFAESPVRMPLQNRICSPPAPGLWARSRRTATSMTLFAQGVIERMLFCLEWQ